MNRKTRAQCTRALEDNHGPCVRLRETAQVAVFGFVVVQSRLKLQLEFAGSSEMHIKNGTKHVGLNSLAEFQHLPPTKANSCSRAFVSFLCPHALVK